MKISSLALCCLLNTAPALFAQFQAATPEPKPAAELQAASFKYRVTVELRAQKIEFTVSTSIADAGASWTVVNTMDTPQGTATDTATLAKPTLFLLKRSLRQGPVDIEVNYADGKADGSLTMGGQVKPIAAELGGPVFADAAGADQVIATLPLAVGYTAQFRNFDVQSGAVRQMQLTVPAVETVSVPAGTFEAFRVEVSSADADRKTLWVARDTRKVVKVTAVLAASMAGATLTQQLTE